MAALTINHVAEKAGVSKATVSRVINRSSRVAPDVAKRVQEAIEQTGYQLPARRPGLRPARRLGIRTGNILFLALGFPADDPYGLVGYPDILRGVESELAQNGLKMMLASLAADGPLPLALNANEVDGVMLFGHSTALCAVAKARLREMPAVCLMRGFEEFRGQIDRVIFNNAPVGPMAAQYLAAREHKLVAFYSINPNHPAINTRRHDFARAAGEAGMEVLQLVSPHEAAGRHHETAEHQSLAERLAAASPRPTGLFVPMGFWVPYAYQALRRYGIEPGRDIDIIACDNVPLFMNQLSPQPAIIDINLPMVGVLGVRQLLWRMASRDVKNSIELSVEPILLPGSEPAEQTFV